MYKLDNWSLVQLDPYQPLEVGLHLSGEIFGHPEFPDGEKVTTSHILHGDGPLVYTQSGSCYELGSPNQEYVEYLKKTNQRLPTKEEPIKWHHLTDIFTEE